MSVLEEAKDFSNSASVVEIGDQSNVFMVHNKPVMLEAVNVVSLLGKTRKAIIKAKGDSIPNAVAIANIITEKMLKGTSSIQKIQVDSEGKAGIGKMLSTIEIVVLKN